MHAYLPLSLVLALTACASGSNSSGPGKLPDDANGAMYTSKPAADVATCMATSIGGTTQPEADRYIVTAPSDNPVTFSVGPSTTESVYATQVVIRGDYSDDEQRRKAALCL